MENPYGLPEDVRGELAALVGHTAINRYPDAAAARAQAALRSMLGIPAGHASSLLGNGSDEIIQLLMLATARPGAVVLGVEPSFVMFRADRAVLRHALRRRAACAGLLAR